MNTNRHRRGRCGYTLVEMIAAIGIMAFAVVGTLSGYLYVIRGERLNSIQNELDINVRQAMERIRADLRLSSMDKIFFYPEGAGPYTGVSLPLARDDDGDGVIEAGTNGMIIWDQTLVYHVWPVTPWQLRLTTFDPRDNNLTAVDRQAQINSVVANGNGVSTFEGAGASTRAIFENLFTWEIRGKGATYDAYSAALTRDASVILGSVVLSSGAHNFKFDVIGKSASSSGYKIGLDTLVVSPCGIPRETEAQLPVSAQSGAAAAAEYMSAGSWSGNNQLSFPAVAAGNYVTLSMANDRWEETNFRDTAALCEDVIVEFNETLSPKDYVLMLGAPTNAWQADWQTLDPTGGSSASDRIRACAVRTLVRGGMMQEGGAIRYNGPLHCVWFYASANALLGIVEARIAEAADHLNYTMNAADSGLQLYFGGSSNVLIPQGAFARGELASGSQLYIDKNKSYVVTYLVVDNSGQSDARYWVEQHVGSPTNPAPVGCYMIPKSAAPTVADVRAPVWSTNANVVSTNRLYSLEHLHVLAVSNGTFTSQIVDTQLNAPQYTDISWNADKPSGTYLGFKVRTGNNADMSDAAAWSNVAAITAPGGISPGNRRYVQFQVEMRPDATGYYVPSVKDVTIKWTGEQRVTDVGGTVTKGPEYGIFELTVDGKQLVKGMTVDLTIFQDIYRFGGGSNRLTSTLTAEVEPRNTGK